MMVAGVQEGDVETQCRASLALCMLLLLKQHLKGTYGLTTERITNFNPGVFSTSARALCVLAP